jgi:hypothetical protein
VFFHAALRDDAPAVLDVLRFPADGKNRTALPSSQDCPRPQLPVSASQAARDTQRCRQARYWIVAFIADEAGRESSGKESG